MDWISSWFTPNQRREFRNLRTSCIETVTRCYQDTSVCTKLTIVATALIGFVAIAGIAMVTLGCDLSDRAPFAEFEECGRSWINM